MANAPAVNNASTPNYSLDQILQSTQPKQPGAFRRILGSVVGGVGNLVAPGVGGLIGGVISGGSIGGSIGGILGGGGLSGALSVGSGLMGDTEQFLQLQQTMAQQQELFETASAIVKSRHDAAMASIRNIN
jgi:hypothetical protein